MFNSCRTLVEQLAGEPRIGRTSTKLGRLGPHFGRSGLNLAKPRPSSTNVRCSASLATCRPLVGRPLSDVASIGQTLAQIPKSWRLGHNTATRGQVLTRSGGSVAHNGQLWSNLGRRSALRAFLSTMVGQLRDNCLPKMSAEFDSADIRLNMAPQWLDSCARQLLTTLGSQKTQRSPMQPEVAELGPNLGS